GYGGAPARRPRGGRGGRGRGPAPSHRRRPMNFVILGDGPEERAWAEALSRSSSHRLAAAFPGLPGHPELPGRGDLDAALAVAGVGAAIVGGDDALRPEGLRRSAGAGLPV